MLEIINPDPTVRPYVPSLKGAWQQERAAQKEIVEQATTRVQKDVGVLYNALASRAIPTDVEVIRTRPHRPARPIRSVARKLRGDYSTTPPVEPVVSMGRGWQISGYPYLGEIEHDAIPRRTITLMESGNLVMGEPYSRGDTVEDQGLVCWTEFPLHPFFAMPKGFVDVAMLGEFSTPEARVCENLAYFERSIRDAGRYLLDVSVNGA